MANTLTDLYNGQPEATDTTLYTSGANTRTKIMAASVVNDTTTTRYISFHRVPSGSSVGDTNIIINRKIVGSRESVALWELLGQVLEPGDFLSAIAEAAEELTVHISGISVT